MTEECDPTEDCHHPAPTMDIHSDAEIVLNSEVHCPDSKPSLLASDSEITDGGRRSRQKEFRERQRGRFLSSDGESQTRTRSFEPPSRRKGRIDYRERQKQFEEKRERMYELFFSSAGMCTTYGTSWTLSFVCGENPSDSGLNADLISKITSNNLKRELEETEQRRRRMYPSELKSELVNPPWLSSLVIDEENEKNWVKINFLWLIVAWVRPSTMMVVRVIWLYLAIWVFSRALAALMVLQILLDATDNDSVRIALLTSLIAIIASAIDLVLYSIRGLYSDRFGRRLQLYISSVTEMVVFIALLISQSIEAVIFGVVIKAVFGSTSLTLSSMLGDLLERQPTTLAELNALSGIIAGLASLFGALIGLAVLFLDVPVQGPLGVVVALMVLNCLIVTTMPETRQKRGEDTSLSETDNPRPLPAASEANASVRRRSLSVSTSQSSPTDWDPSWLSQADSPLQHHSDPVISSRLSDDNSGRPPILPGPKLSERDREQFRKLDEFIRRKSEADLFNRYPQNSRQKSVRRWKSSQPMSIPAEKHRVLETANPLRAFWMVYRNVIRNDERLWWIAVHECVAKLGLGFGQAVIVFGVEVFGWTAFRIGLYVVLTGVASGLSSTLTGRLTKLLGPPVFVSFARLQLFAYLLGLVVLRNELFLYLWTLALFPFAVTGGLVLGSIKNSIVPSHLRASSASFYSTLDQLVGILRAYMVAFLFWLFVDQKQHLFYFPQVSLLFCALTQLISLYSLSRAPVWNKEDLHRMLHGLTLDSETSVLSSRKHLRPWGEDTSDVSSFHPSQNVSA